MFRFVSLLLLLAMALASSDQAPVQADSLLSSRSRRHRRRRSKRCKEKVKANVTDASATGPGESDGTSIMCTDLVASDIPSKTKIGDYFYLKVNGNYKKVLYTEANSNWEGDYDRSIDGVVTFQTPSVKTSPIAAGDVSPITISPANTFFPASGVVDGDEFEGDFPVGGTTFPATNVHGLVTFNSGTYKKIGSESPIPDTLSTGTYYAFITNTDNTGTCPNGVLAIGLQDGEASSENNLDVDTGDTLKLYFKSKNCGGKKCGSSGGRSKRRRRHRSDVEGDEVEVGDLAEFEEGAEDNGEDGFAQFWADNEADANDDWEEEAEEGK